MRDEEEYLALFTDSGDARRVGEACVFNLFSTVAAARIEAVSPDAKIIIMLRDPVEQMYSYHSVRRRNATEDLDFEAALAAEADRREGRRLPRLARNVKMYQYRAVASYTDQVARYFDAFGRENVHVVIFDDFVRDPAASYRATLEFLVSTPTSSRTSRSSTRTRPTSVRRLQCWCEIQSSPAASSAYCPRCCMGRSGTSASVYASGTGNPRDERPLIRR